jgi:hypothetical protein
MKRTEKEINHVCSMFHWRYLTILAFELSKRLGLYFIQGPKYALPSIFHLSKILKNNMSSIDFVRPPNRPR